MLLAWKVTKALFARILFATHSIIAIWRLYAETRNIFAMLFAIAPISLFLEAAVTILWRHGDEYKWFCPSIFLFLVGSVPPIWFMEMTLSEKFINNQTNYLTPEDERLFENFNIRMPTFPKELWVQLVEQSLLVVLILGRWLLPKGRITRDELSQLLLAYVAISADIIELFNMFTLEIVRGSHELSLVTLIVWSVSLVQFPLVMTTVKSQKARYCWSSTRLNEMDDLTNSNYTLSPNYPMITYHNQPQPHHVNNALSPKRKYHQIPYQQQAKQNKSCAEKCCDISVWGIISTVLLQDAPFLGLRIYVIFWKGVTNYSMFFFVSKNSLIIMVQIYRLLVLCCDSSASGANGNGGNGGSLADPSMTTEIPGERFYLLQHNGSAGSSLTETPKKKYSRGSGTKFFPELKEV